LKLRIRRRTAWTIAVGVAATVLVVLLILIAAGVLVVPGTGAPAPVNVSSVQFKILQGTNVSGNGWFGPSVITYTGLANGYPFQVAPGGGFSVPITFENYDSMPHTLYSISVAGPFTFAGSSPTLPQTLRAYQDDAYLMIDVTAPSTSGVTLSLFIEINALPPTS
jgi:hypothetical protein